MRRRVCSGLGAHVGATGRTPSSSSRRPAIPQRTREGGSTGAAWRPASSERDLSPRHSVFSRHVGRTDVSTMSLFMQQQQHASHPGSGGAGDDSAPQTTRTLSRQGSSNDSFVCNVSDDAVIERDVDLEIEARMRSETSSSRQSSRSSSSTKNRSTLSQRMLSALQRKKNRTVVEEATRPKRRGSVLLDVIADDEADHSQRPGSNHSMGADIDGLVVPDPLYDPSQDPVYMSDDDSHIAQMSTSTCKDRLEARISERRQQNKSPLSSRPSSLDGASADVNEMSTMYSIRNTYPAESAKRLDPRFSENLDSLRSERPHPTREQRAMPPFPQHPIGLAPMDPTVETNLDANKSLPVSFHFEGSAPVERPAPSRSFNSSRLEHTPQPRVVPQPSRDDPYTTMRTSVEQIEQVVDGLENLLMAASFSSLAAVALKELELLRESTKQLRTNGTTMILAEIGRPQSKMLGPSRQLVARAASVQSRIEFLIDRIKTMV